MIQSKQALHFFIISLFFKTSVSFAKNQSWDDLTLKDVLNRAPLNRLKTSFQIKTTVTEVKSQKNKKNLRLTASESVLSEDYKANESFVFIRDPAILEELESKGFDFYSHFGTSQPSTQLAYFYKNNSSYKLIADTVKSDLSQMAIEENANKQLPKVGVGMAFSRRLFDGNWFQSSIAKFELVGVINRLDRVAFDSNTCGETRFIYRLSYTSKAKNYSRLPMTLMVKYNNQGQAKKSWDDCKNLAKAWIYPENIQNNSDLIDWLIKSGPLKNGLLEKIPHSVELNLQAMRIPSKARIDLAGHGTYLLRSFRFTSDARLQIGPLENTPDVKKINSTKELKQELLQSFNDRHFINRLSEGILKLDEKFLATKAWSYSPYGIGRKENRLFDQIISEEDLKNIKFNQSPYVKSAKAAIMRLNDLSCVGCHQARAHAGFHFLGIDKKSTHPLNSIFFEGSGHFELEIRRRTEYLKQVVEKGIWPDPSRDLSISPGEIYQKLSGATFKKAEAGHFCGLNNGPFMHWQCAEGLECQQVDEAEGQNILGKCFPKVSMAGDPVLFGEISQEEHSVDKLKIKQRRTCGSLDPKYSFGIFENGGGFPSGICYRRNCHGIKSSTEVCADSAGAGFNECIAQTSTGKVSFASCLEKTVTHFGMARCDQNHACRNDFVCARSVKNEGYCTPSYFLFQVRLDGHADPIKGN